ncbi:unnamed protein product, partial [marine sediment metagenome]
MKLILLALLLFPSAAQAAAHTVAVLPFENM